MKKIAAALLLSTAVAAPAFAADTGFYAGVALGRSNTGNIAANTVMTKSSDTVGSILAGYQFNKNWGVEALFGGAGKFTATTGTVNLSGKTDVFSIAATGTLPMSNALSLYGKLGIASARTSLSSIPASNAAGKTASNATFGLGLQYNATSAVGIRLGWDRYRAEVTAAPATNKFNENVYSLGAVFKF